MLLTSSVPTGEGWGSCSSDPSTPAPFPHWGGESAKHRKQLLMPRGFYLLSHVGGSSLGSRNAHLFVRRSRQLVQSIACSLPRCW